MKPSEYKLKIGELLSYMRKTMSVNSYTKGEEVVKAATERLPKDSLTVLQALKDLGVLQTKLFQTDSEVDVYYYRLGESFIKVTSHAVMRQMGLIKGNEPKITQKERVACLPDSGSSSEMEYVIRLGDFHYSEPVRGLDKAREKAREMMNIHNQLSAMVFRFDRVIEISSQF